MQDVTLEPYEWRPASFEYGDDDDDEAAN